MANVSLDNGLEGSSERRLCQERNSPKTSLPKVQVKRRSTSSRPQTSGAEILPRTPSRYSLKFRFGLVCGFQWSNNREFSWRSASIEAASALKRVSSD